MGRRHRFEEIDHELPWQFEAVFWGVGTFGGVIAAVIFMWRVTAPARRVEQVLGIQIRIDSMLDATWPYALLVGLFSAMSARWAVRRCFIRRLSI